jgi:type II secretory pathway component PulC
MTAIRALLAAAGVLFSPPALAGEASTGAVQRPQPVLANPLAAQSLDRLSATRERPLFSPDRRPPPPPPAPIVREAEPPPPPPPPKISLYGIVLDSNEAYAIVRADAAKIARVRIGDDVSGWKVSQIAPRRLVLSLDGRHATFTLFAGEREKQSPPEPPAATPAEPRAQAQPQENASPQTRSRRRRNISQ